MASGVVKNPKNGVVADSEIVIQTSMFEYAKHVKGIAFVITPSGMTDNPTSTGSFFHLILKRSTGRVIISSGIDNSVLFKAFSNTSGETFYGWNQIQFS